MKIKITIFEILIVLLLSSCIVYHPQTIDIPLISEKNDLRVDAGISVVPSAHATISYGLTNKVSIQGFGSVGPDDRYYFQAATGLYKKHNKNKVMELYCGYGYGHGDAFKDANPGHLFGNYQLYFAQYNYGIIANEKSNFETGIGIKSGLFHSSLTDKNYYHLYSEPGSFITYQDNSLLLEPAGFIRIGGKKLRLSINLGGAILYKLTNSDKSIPNSYLNLGLGLNYRL
jgi:hypothetical protein